jgi:hypothetical protein
MENIQLIMENHGAVWFLLGLFIQWAYERIFSDLFQEMDEIANRIRLQREIEARERSFNWGLNFYRRKAVMEYSQQMDGLADKLSSKQIVLGEQPKS